VDDKGVMEKFEIPLSMPADVRHDFSLETAKIMFHGTNQGLTSGEVVRKLFDYYMESQCSMPRDLESIEGAALDAVFGDK